MTRIDTNSVKGVARYEREYNIGYQECAGCGVETPPAPQSVIDRLAAERSTVSTIWPFEHWAPTGWMTIREVGHICDACSRAVTKLLRLRKHNPGCEVSETTYAATAASDDAVILRENTRRALELANEGLLTEYPPQPVRRRSQADWYGHPTLRFVWENYADYRQGMLRHRIREIHNALSGLPINDDGDRFQ